MKEKLIGREFQVWDFWVSHSQLLIRSPQNLGDKQPTNIDVRFIGVEYMELPGGGFSLEIEEAQSADKEFVKLRIGRDIDSEDTLYILKCGGRRYLVVAWRMSIEENKLDLFESSLQRKF